MDGKTIFFTHIPKTAGTSMHEAVFAPNIPASERRSGVPLRDLLTESSSLRYVRGHMPYGYHRFMPVVAEALYFVVLRNPIERAISHYYNILHPRGNKTVPDHPEFETARSHGLVEFYEIPRFQNLQTRMVAGIAVHKFGERISLNGEVRGTVALSVAKRNLREVYDAAGFTEAFVDTARCFASRLGFTYEPHERNEKAVPNRPTADDLSAADRAALRRRNRLDVELYDYARTLFPKLAR
ncbi:sulfotransferase family protein [Salinibacter ruber]|uniref:sulfotransferase family protein n=1 Tax=Salinibacter ruber TaxID=146919 RepID=UPI002166F23D|nr:sulfotransferase family protein [Salinibacter ruber]MCS4188210.1 hypothetical protein [Salinibacter ruber]